VLSFAQIFAMRYLTAALFTTTIFFSACNNSDTTAEQEKSAPQAMAESRHSSAFNQSVQSAMQTYYSLSEAFVNWDSVAVSSFAKELSGKLDSLSLIEIKDSAANTTSPGTYIADAKKDLSGMMAANDITTKRHALNSFTDHLYQFLNAAKYDRQKLYLQECPMAFNDEEPGVWLSPGDSIRNPYLGLHHPRYGKGMLECGDNKEVLNFTGIK
jgi:hypothetical protein